VEPMAVNIYAVKFESRHGLLCGPKGNPLAFPLFFKEGHVLCNNQPHAKFGNHYVCFFYVSGELDTYVILSLCNT
jgi:hypothetical protein